MQLPVPLVVRVVVRNQILVAEVFENLLEKLVEPAEVLGEERTAAADRGELSQHRLQFVRADSASLPDHVDGRVAAFGAADRRLHGGMARLVVAVTEEQHRTAAGMAAEQVEAVQD